MHTHAIVHLVKSNDWLNDYEEQRLGEKILQSQIDNVNITTLQNNNTIHNKQANNYLHKYRSYIDTLHADKSVDDKVKEMYLELKTNILTLGKDIEVRPKKHIEASICVYCISEIKA
jgi:altronate dehydratase